MKKMTDIDEEINSTRASRAGHTFHDRWAARRALQLVFPHDELFAIAVEGISSTETSAPGASAEEVADLVFYYGEGDNFQTCERFETVQFKYKLRMETVSASYLKKTIKKFADTILGYERNASEEEVDAKASFLFVTNAEFNPSLWAAIKFISSGTQVTDASAVRQAQGLIKWCTEQGLADAHRLFSRISFRAGERDLSGQDAALSRTLTDWSGGTDPDARIRLFALQDLVHKKAGPGGQRKNLIHREDVLDALGCEQDDLFPADTQFVEIGKVVPREEISMVRDLVNTSTQPVFVHAEGGMGKTVFVQSLASEMLADYEVVVFDCFGGGSYRSENQSRHLPKIGLVQIVNELAARTLCDPLLPGTSDRRQLVKAACKRFRQAAVAIKGQSHKLGLLIIIDAADNAQIEAVHRHEDPFPKLLLAAIDEDSIDGVKLLLTARTYRRHAVIDRARVSEFELGPFTDQEARAFLKNRRTDLPTVELTTALARSRRIPRVLDYLDKTWDVNVRARASALPITVLEIIAQHCTKIERDLRVAGWSNAETTEFFVAMSLLPAPIPLDELAAALGWSAAHVNTAASDLVPMLEITSHGAMFRDEPTEAFIRDTYSGRPIAQRAIADRLMTSQGTSAYAAEALPHFLVVIDDSDRAFALADSTMFPTSVTSEFGRRRLTLVRLRAAFRLAVAADDYDRLLGLSMRLAQAKAADSRGGEFIRRSPALAILLGDKDAYRRLFADRSGWRGARSARLTVAHTFAGNAEDAQIESASTVRWINWSAGRQRGNNPRDRTNPDVDDFAAILLQRAMTGDFRHVDRNLGRWNTQFSAQTSDRLLQMLQLHDAAKGTTLFHDVAAFAASNQSVSRILKLHLLARPRNLTKPQIRKLARGSAPMTSNSADSHVDDQIGFSYGSGRSFADVPVLAALTSLVSCSRAAAAAIIRHEPSTRPSVYDYGERLGSSAVWQPILRAYVRAWSAGRPVSYHDLLPNNVEITKVAKGVSTKSELLKFLAGLQERRTEETKAKGEKILAKPKFSHREQSEISEGIERVLGLMRPIEDAVVVGGEITSASVTLFLDVWADSARDGVDWRAQRSTDLLSRTVGIGCAHILLNQCLTISNEQARKLVALISSNLYFVPQKIEILSQLAQWPALHQIAGEFAQHIARQIEQDDNISTRGNAYLELASVLVSLSVEEARVYYQVGLGQLDQMGGESHQQINSLLEFASAQRGGSLKPELAQRLMNLCQVVFADEPSKFNWPLFGRAAANSVGFSAIAKLLRWHNQDVAPFSYGLPQLACFLSTQEKLDPRRAAFIFSICEEHGTWNWRSGDAVAELMKVCEPSDQRCIFLAVYNKLRGEYPFGAWSSLWEPFLQAANKYPDSITEEERAAINDYVNEAERKRDEFNSRSNPQPRILPEDSTDLDVVAVASIVAPLVLACDPYSARSIDEGLREIRMLNNTSYITRPKFIAGLRDACSYSKRIEFLTAICDTTALNFSQTLDIFSESFQAWTGSSVHLQANANRLVERLFECKGADLFAREYSDLTNSIRQLSNFCGDLHFVLRLVLRKVAADEVALEENEWLQLATTLCEVASGQAGLGALELLLSGPESRIADDIGEGPFCVDHEVAQRESELIADILWQLLGDDDCHVRWSVAREISTLIELGLTDEIRILLSSFDRREVRSMSSMEVKLSFQNSQQWLLMGLARAALQHGEAMSRFRPQLLALARRTDLHVINKLHLARCLRNIGNGGNRDILLEKLFDEIDHPAHGILITDFRPPVASTESGFHFDGDFSRYEINRVARLFNIAQGTATDAVAAEITRRWPEAASFDFSPRRRSYSRDNDERYELYREHVQRHALLQAGTALSKSMPAVVRSNETYDRSPWLEWRERYDVTFDDGSWLSDRKDLVPQQAKMNLLSGRVENQEMLHDQLTVMRILGFVDVPPDALFPLFGRWTSPDGVTVSIHCALTKRQGAVNRCVAFSRKASRDFWLPEFWDDGYYEQSGRRKNLFTPFIWARDDCRLGIDVGDEIASEGPARRARLGISQTQELGLVNDLHDPDWFTATGELAIRSQVWGGWNPHSERRSRRSHDNGDILWASPDWLTQTLRTLDRQLVFTITLWKFPSSRDYDEATGAKSVLVGLRDDDGALRVWNAERASR